MLGNAWDCAYWCAASTAQKEKGQAVWTRRQKSSSLNNINTVTTFLALLQLLLLTPRSEPTGQTFITIKVCCVEANNLSVLSGSVAPYCTTDLRNMTWYGYWSKLQYNFLTFYKLYEAFCHFSHQMWLFYCNRISWSVLFLLYPSNLPTINFFCLLKTYFYCFVFE